METDEQLINFSEEKEPDYMESFIYSVCFDHQLSVFLPVMGGL